MGRRRFMETLGGFGVSSATLSQITPEKYQELVDDPNKEVPYVARMRHTNHEAVRKGAVPKREPVYDTVSRRHWVRVETAHNAAKRLGRRLRKQHDTSLIRPSVTTIRPRRGDEKAIEIQYVARKREVYDPGAGEWTTVTDRPDVAFDALERSVPGRINGVAAAGRRSWRVKNIPVEVERVEEADRGCGSHYDTEYYPNPGGCRIKAGKGIGSNPPGTFGTPAVDVSTSHRRMITAGHLVEGSNRIYQPSSGDDNIEGYVRKYVNEPNRDFAVIVADTNHTGSEQYSYRLAAEGGGHRNEIYILGSLSWSSIKYNEGNPGYELEKQGDRSGVTSGYITSVSNLNGVRIVDTNIPGDNGDSGGPIYKLYDNDTVRPIYIAAIHSRGPSNPGCPDVGSKGNIMVDIEDYYSLRV